MVSIEIIVTRTTEMDSTGCFHFCNNQEEEALNLRVLALKALEGLHMKVSVGRQKSEK